MWQPVPRARKEPDVESESAGGSTIQAGPENVDEREDQPQDEVLNEPTEQRVERSQQPAQLPANCRQMPVVPQPMGDGRPPTFQYLVTPGPEPTFTSQPALVPENQPMLPEDEFDDRQKVASWLYDEEDDDMESVLDPNHPAQAQMEDEGWDQLRDEEAVPEEAAPNPGRAPYVDHEDRCRKPVTRDQKRVMKAKSRAEKRNHKHNYNRKLIPSALRLPKQSAPLPAVSKQSAILPAPAVSREPVPTERPTLLPPMFNIMGGRVLEKVKIFQKKVRGKK